MRRRFQQLDVFADTAYLGNPVAVIVDGEGLTTEQMATIARWTNLSETTFLLPSTTPQADYRVRIFTLAGELPFAGHPTLGSCQAWLQTGGIPNQPEEIVQECDAGLVRVRPTDEGLAFAAPPRRRSGPVDEPFLLEVAAVLGVTRDQIVDATWADNGPGWVAVLLEDAENVLALEPDHEPYTGEDMLAIGVIGPYPPGSGCDVEVRAIFGDDRGGLREDPVTGSLNASVGQWLLEAGHLTAPYLVSQGTRLGREGRPHVTQDADGTVWVGGRSITCIEGTIEA